jgi:hypothetical protein
VEEVHAQVVARNQKEANDIAENVGLGETIYPGVDRYNVADREPVLFDVISVECVKS